MDRTSARILATITETPLEERDAVRFVSTPASGGIVVFSGVVRDHNAGRTVESIEYSAARPLADAQLFSLCEEILREVPDVHRVAAVHRLGPLRVGESSVVVAASAAHRDAAFEGARRLIDRIKRVLPVWKLERSADGTEEWVPGFTIASNEEAS